MYLYVVITAHCVFICYYHGSLCIYSYRLQIPEKEYAEGLRKWQSQKLAYHRFVVLTVLFVGGFR